MRIKKKKYICQICSLPCFGKKYCTECYTTKAQIGRTPWNKGKKTELVPKTAFLKGVRFNPLGEFRKGEGKHFSGSTKEYKSLHAWINYNLGKATMCLRCRSIKFVQWANRSQNYLRDLNDWMPLCKKCHFSYDRSTVAGK